MNQDDILRMAREGKSVVEQVHAYVSVNNTDFTSESMSAMVHDFIVAEREACAKVCEALRPFGPELALQKATAEDCAASIRARGQK